MVVNDLDTPGSDFTMNAKDILLGAVGVDKLGNMDMLRLTKSMDAPGGLDLSSRIQSRLHCRGKG